MKIIPDEELYRGYKKMVHVDGWSVKRCFHFISIENGVKKLITPRTKRVYYTKNNLITTIKNS